MFTNPEVFEKKHKCNKYISKYLIEKCGLPLLGSNNGEYYFYKTDELDRCLNEMPILVRILGKILS